MTNRPTLSDSDKNLNRLSKVPRKGFAKVSENPNTVNELKTVPPIAHHIHGIGEPLPHMHAHTIPVEWESIKLDNQPGFLNVVTRLRCSCGDEVDRETLDSEEEQ